MTESSDEKEARQRGEVVHIAGREVQIGALLRQRCSWCGALLIDYDISRIAVPVGQDLYPGTWAVGGLVGVLGNAQYAVAHNDGDCLPSTCCGSLDPEVSR